MEKPSAQEILDALSELTLDQAVDIALTKLSARGTDSLPPGEKAAEEFIGRERSLFHAAVQQALAVKLGWPGKIPPGRIIPWSLFLVRTIQGQTRYRNLVCSVASCVSLILQGVPRATALEESAEALRESLN